jgi:membrane protein implicated in regulation of membrane protease activity
MSFSDLVFTARLLIPAVLVVVLFVYFFPWWISGPAVGTLVALIALLRCRIVDRRRAAEKKKKLNHASLPAPSEERHG